MPINGWPDKENVVHIHRGILCSHKKVLDYVLCSNMNGAKGHYSQKTNAGTENQTSHVLIYKWETNSKNIWTTNKRTTDTRTYLMVENGRRERIRKNIPLKYCAEYLGNEVRCTPYTPWHEFTCIRNLGMYSLNFK